MLCAIEVPFRGGTLGVDRATHDCVRSWLTDFRGDLKIRVPTLVFHGDDDRTLPLAATGGRMNKFAEGSRMVTVPGGPHGLNWTHAAEVNRALLEFLGR